MNLSVSQTGASAPPSPKNPPRADPSESLLVAMLFGVVIGAFLMVLVRYAVPYLPPHLSEHTDALSGPKLLAEATNGKITYRASATGITPGSEIEKAIMAEQPANVELLNKINPDSPSAPRFFDVRYVKTAQAGPLSSILKVENVTWNNDRKKARYASTLLNELRPKGFALADIFSNRPQDKLQLDGMICDALHQLRRMRVGKDSEFFCGLKHQFLAEGPVVFLPSDQPDALGGLRFYFEAGEVGDAAEGDYILTIPQSRFRDYVVPAYRGLFDGKPLE